MPVHETVRAYARKALVMRGALRLTAPFLPVGAALFCIQLDFFSLNLALPTIAADLGSTPTNLPWLVSGYLIALGAPLIPAGRVGDILGRRAVLLTGVAIFGATSLVCGLTSAVPVLIGARVVQGFGAALILPSAFALVTNATDETDRPRVVGTLLGIAGIGTALGPVVGGSSRQLPGGAGCSCSTCR
jgi:MFS family permease